MYALVKKNWYRQFKYGHTNVDNLPRSERLSSVYSDGNTPRRSITRKKLNRFRQNLFNPAIWDRDKPILQLKMC